MTVLDTWRIAKGRSACRRCQAEFRDGQSFYSALREDGGELARDDFCEACWNEGRSADHFCFWRGRRDTSERPRAVNADLVLEFFERLDALELAKRQVFRFVLALYLMRRRAFRLMEVARADGVEVLVFEHRATRNTVRVESPGLTEDQIEETEEQLSRLLNVCL
jgi:hypothetical protein